MSQELIEILIFATIRNATPLMFAGLGILILEKSGVLNLGQEGLVALSAVLAFIAAHDTGSTIVALICGCCAAIFLNVIYALLTLVCRAPQVVSGLSVSILGVGLAAFFGSGYVGLAVDGIDIKPLGFLSSVPLLGKAFFEQNVMVYAAWLLAPMAFFGLYRTRMGMLVRATGEDPLAVRALGYSPNKIRFSVLLLSGGLVGLSGAFLTLTYTPMLTEGISSGRGWIALALVVFASHKVFRLSVGAMLFGFTSLLHLALQGAGVNISGSLLAMLPYVITIVSLVIISWRSSNHSGNSPRSLGQNFTVSN